jgi:hypothetical protein
MDKRDRDLAGMNDSANAAELQAIAAAYYAQYALAIDNRDEATLISLLDPHVELTREGVRQQGIESFLVPYRDAWAQPFLSKKHYITNIQSEPEDGVGIRVHAYFCAVAIMTDRVDLTFGYYDDSLIARGTTWLLSHKRTVTDAVVPLLSSAPSEQSNQE